MTFSPHTPSGVGVGSLCIHQLSLWVGEYALCTCGFVKIVFLGVSVVNSFYGENIYEQLPSIEGSLHLNHVDLLSVNELSFVVCDLSFLM